MRRGICTGAYARSLVWCNPINDVSEAIVGLGAYSKGPYMRQRDDGRDISKYI